VSSVSYENRHSGRLFAARTLVGCGQFVEFHMFGTVALIARMPYVMEDGAELVLRGTVTLTR